MQQVFRLRCLGADAIYLSGSEHVEVASHPPDLLLLLVRQLPSPQPIAPPTNTYLANRIALLLFCRTFEFNASYCKLTAAVRGQLPRELNAAAPVHYFVSGQKALGWILAASLVSFRTYINPSSYCKLALMTFGGSWLPKGINQVKLRVIRVFGV